MSCEISLSASPDEDSAAPAAAEDQGLLGRVLLDAPVEVSNTVHSPAGPQKSSQWGQVSVEDSEGPPTARGIRVCQRTLWYPVVGCSCWPAAPSCRLT